MREMVGVEIEERNLTGTSRSLVENKGKWLRCLLRINTISCWFRT